MDCANTLVTKQGIRAVNDSEDLNIGIRRRKLLEGMAVAILGLSIGTATLMPTALHAAEQRRPNIIFMFADDQAKESMGYTGNPVIETPNMDRLAREGVFFRTPSSLRPSAPSPGPASSRASTCGGTALWILLHPCRTRPSIKPILSSCARPATAQPISAILYSDLLATGSPRAVF